MLEEGKRRYNFVKDKHEPIRMRIVCKNRYLQENMHRSKHFQGELYKDFVSGRGVYLCETCILSEGKVSQKALFKSCKNLNTKITQ